MKTLEKFASILILSLTIKSTTAEENALHERDTTEEFEEYLFSRSLDSLYDEFWPRMDPEPMLIDVDKCRYCKTFWAKTELAAASRTFHHGVKHSNKVEIYDPVKFDIKMATMYQCHYCRCLYDTLDLLQQHQRQNPEHNNHDAATKDTENKGVNIAKNKANFRIQCPFCSMFVRTSGSFQNRHIKDEHPKPEEAQG